MKVRTLSTMLWFITGWSATGFVVGVLALPSSLAMVGGIAIAMIVWFDPSGRLWGKAKPQRRVRPIEEVAAELDSQAGNRAREAIESQSR
jgi:hypothetical protein